MQTNQEARRGHRKRYRQFVDPIRSSAENHNRGDPNYLSRGKKKSDPWVGASHFL